MRFWTRSPALFGALAVLDVACSRLPHAAAPKVSTVANHPQPPGEDLTRYRRLTRADFKSSAPPREFASIANQVGAATCTRVSSSPATRVVITAHRRNDGEMEFRARIVDLGFVAVMDRACSWWNDERAAFSPGYILQHEQIHFALSELIARRLSAEATGALQDRQFTAGTRERALELAQRSIHERLSQGTEAMLAENRAFDEETSMGHRPERQRRWLERVERELALTQRWAFVRPDPDGSRRDGEIRGLQPDAAAPYLEAGKDVR